MFSVKVPTFDQWHAYGSMHEMSFVTKWPIRCVRTIVHVSSWGYRFLLHKLYADFNLQAEEVNMHRDIMI